MQDKQDVQERIKQLRRNQEQRRRDRVKERRKEHRKERALNSLFGLGLVAFGLFWIATGIGIYVAQAPGRSEFVQLAMFFICIGIVYGGGRCVFEGVHNLAAGVSELRDWWHSR